MCKHIIELVYTKRERRKTFSQCINCSYIHKNESIPARTICIFEKMNSINGVRIQTQIQLDEQSRKLTEKMYAKTFGTGIGLWHWRRNILYFCGGAYILLNTIETKMKNTFSHVCQFVWLIVESVFVLSFLLLLLLFFLLPSVVHWYVRAFHS